MHLDTRDHFWSRDKDGGHTIRYAVVENPMLYANVMALFFIEPELWEIEVYIAEIGISDVFGSCDLDLDPMIVIYKLDSYCLEIRRMCKYELPTRDVHEAFQAETEARPRRLPVDPRRDRDRGVRGPRRDRDRGPRRDRGISARG